MKRFRKQQPMYEMKVYDKFNPDFIRQIFHLCLLGATDKQMSVALNVSISTLERWKRERPDFLESIQKGKMQADANVAQSLYAAAIGYSHEDHVILPNKIKEYDANGKVVSERTEPLIVKTVKHYPPNVPAAIKWLSSRQPGVWGDTKKIDIKGNVTVHHQVDFSDFDEAELEVMRKLGLQNIVDDIPFEEMD